MSGSEHFHPEPDEDGWERILIQSGLLHYSLVDSPRGVAVKEVEVMLSCRDFYKGGNCGPAFITQIVQGASFTGSAWYENEREVGSGLFSFHTESEQNNCLRKTYCIFLSYLISFPASTISKLSELSDVWQKAILQNLCRYLTWGSILLHQYYFSHYSDYNEQVWVQRREEISYALKSDISWCFFSFSVLLIFILWPQTLTYSTCYTISALADLFGPDFFWLIQIYVVCSNFLVLVFLQSHYPDLCSI